VYCHYQINSKKSTKSKVNIYVNITKKTDETVAFYACLLASQRPRQSIKSPASRPLAAKLT
jgi:hypothetical protein